MGIILTIVSLCVTFWMARRSLVDGICSVLTFGYAFGILRANFPETSSFFIFDAAVLGLYAAQSHLITRPFQTRDGQRLKYFVVFLMLWPILLFLWPQQDLLVQLVGLRGNMFLLPFILIGAHMTDNQRYRVSLWMALLNVIALGFGTAEYILGIQHFFPPNAVTDLIYRSNDVGVAGAYRIPSIFANAHSFGGMMVVSLPWIAGSWVQRHRKVWQKNVLVAGLISALIGVFMSAARIHFLTLILLLTVFTFSTRLRPVYRVGWLLVLVLVGYVVATNERMQRFTTLNNKEYVSFRVQSSVNVSLLEALTEYPFGVGLGGGGTSIPYFLSDKVEKPMAIESELGRIQLEMGIVGTATWIAFVIWVVSRPKTHRGDPWFLGLRLAWFSCTSFLVIGLIGTGLFTAIPSSMLFLLSLGWICTQHTKYVPILVRVPVRKPNRQLMWVTRQVGVVRTS
jgi:hypothetical protein